MQRHTMSKGLSDLQSLWRWQRCLANPVVTARISIHFIHLQWPQQLAFLNGSSPSWSQVQYIAYFGLQPLSDSHALSQNIGGKSLSVSNMVV